MRENRTEQTLSFQVGKECSAHLDEWCSPLGGTKALMGAFQYNHTWAISQDSHSVDKSSGIYL